MQENAAKKNGLNSTKGLLALAVTLNPMELSVTSMKRERERERGEGGGGSRQKRGREFNNLAVRISLLGIKVSDGDALRLLVAARVFDRALLAGKTACTKGEMHVLLRAMHNSGEISPAYLAQRFKKRSTT